FESTNKKVVNETFIKLFKEEQSKDFDLLKKVTTTTYLGLKIDNNWKHESHISYVISKIKQILPKLYTLRNCLNDDNKKLVYDAWIESNIRYGLEVYGNASKTQMLRLQKAQNKAQNKETQR